LEADVKGMMIVMRRMKRRMMIAAVVVVVVVAVGWVKNVIKLANCDFEAPYKGEVIHTLGLIPPVGAITGWIDVGR
jgi:hypothetical protein